MKGIRVSIAALCWVGLAGIWTPFALAGKSRPEVNTPSLLEQQYEREPDPKGRVNIAMDLMDQRLNLLRSAFKSENGHQEQTAQDYLKAVGLLEKALGEASPRGSSKKVEVFLRRHGRELETLKLSVSFFERQALDKALGRIVSLRQAVLYSIMNPPKKR